MVEGPERGAGHSAPRGETPGKFPIQDGASADNGADRRSADNLSETSGAKAPSNGATSNTAVADRQTPKREGRRPRSVSSAKRTSLRRGSAASLGSVLQHTGNKRWRRPDGNNNIAGQTYAALDLGTNNCRLLVARPRRSGFSVIDAYSRTVCLGENLCVSGELQPVAMDRAIEALHVCAAKMARRGVTVSRSIATEACRCASNGEAFLERIRRETGLILEVISPAEEAWLAATGCWPLVDRSCSTALVFDIGGGSTELIWLDLEGARAHGRRPTVAAWTSLPCGVVNLAEQFGTPRLEPEAYPAMVAQVRSALEPFREADARRPDFGCAQAHLVGTSGTVTTLAGLLLGLERYDRERVDGIWLNLDDVSALISRLAGMSAQERAQLPCVGEDRADFVLAGCAILEAVNTLWPTPRLRVADRGLREGILLSLMAEESSHGRRRRPRRMARQKGAVGNG